MSYVNPLFFWFSSLQPTNFSNPVYDSLYNDRHSAGSQLSLPDDDEKKELIDFGDDDDEPNFNNISEKTKILT